MRLTGSLYGVGKLRREINRINPGLVHSFGFRSDFFTFFLKKYKKITTLRNYPRQDYRDHFGALFAPVIASVHLGILRRSRVVACSQALSDILDARESMRISVIQNGIDLEGFSVVNPSVKLALRNKLGLPRDSFLLVTAGSLISRKNVGFILDAFQHVCGSDPHVVLLIAGDGILMNPLRQRCESDKTMFLGNVTNISDYYRASDAYVSASFSEGLPNSVLEAMACGLPCLLSDIPQHAEILQNSGLLKEFLFPLDNPVHLAQKITCLKNRDRSLLSKESRRLVETCFSAESMSRQYQDLYVQLLEDDWTRSKLC
jgi:glycosyltransferase involved in cell wall biosynthesis